MTLVNCSLHTLFPLNITLYIISPPTHRHTHTHMHTHTNLHMHRHTLIHTFIYIHPHINIHPHIHTLIHTCIHILIYTCICIHIVLVTHAISEAKNTMSSNNCQTFYSQSNDLLICAHLDVVIFIYFFVIYIQFI